jgi:hypothetical protein
MRKKYRLEHLQLNKSEFAFYHGSQFVGHDTKNMLEMFDSNVQLVEMFAVIMRECRRQRSSGDTAGG